MRMSSLAFGAILSVVLPVFASAQQNYSQEDANACTNDVYRFCQQAIPDQQRITACLYQHRNQVSPACYAVYKRYSQANKGGHRGRHRYSDED
jgi:type II secretory pathway component PulL